MASSIVRYLHVGGLVAVGFDASGSYLLTITHSGRGVFCTKTWDRIARDYRLAYPAGGFGIGIGPIEGESIPVIELDSSSERRIVNPKNGIELRCQSSGIEVLKSN
jgi:hypothetical protein